MNKLAPNCGSLDEYQKPTKIEAPKILSKGNPDSSNFSSLSSISNDRSIQKYSSLPRLFLTSLDQPSKIDSSNYLNASQSLDDSTMKLSLKDENLSNVMTFGGQKDEKVEFNLNSDIKFDLDHSSTSHLKQKVSRKKSKKRKSSVKKNNLEEEPVKLQRLPAKPPTKKTLEKPPKPVVLKNNKHVDSIKAIESPISVINELDEEHQQSTMQKIPRRINVHESSSDDDYCLSQSQQLLVSPHPPDSNYTSVVSEAFKMPRLNISSQFTTRQSVEQKQLPPIDSIRELTSPICSPSSSKQLHYVKLRQSVASLSTKVGTASEASSNKNDQQTSSREQLVKIQEFNCEPQKQFVEEIPSEDETEKERLAQMFSSSWLAGLVLRNWLTAVKKIKIARSDYETQQSNADQLHYAVLKQKIMRAFTNYCSNQKDKKTVIHRLMEMKQQKTLRFTFNHYRQIVLIGRAMCFFKIKSLVSCFQKWLEYHNFLKCLKGTSLIYNRRLKTKALASLMCFADIVAQKRSRLEVAITIQHKTDSRIQHQVLIHLSAYAVYQRRLRQAKMLSDHKTKFKCLRLLLAFTEKRQSKAQNAELILSFYKCSLASKSLKMLRLGCQLAQQSRFESATKFNHLKRSKLFFAMVTYLNGQSIVKCADIKQARFSLQWLEMSLGPVMEQVWVDFPRQKLARNAQGRHNLLLNFMSLAKRKRYRDFFIKINDQLRTALMARVFDTLYVVTSKTSQGKKNFKSRKVGKLFKAFKDQCCRNVTTRNAAYNCVKKQRRTTLKMVFAALKLVMRVRKSHKAKNYAICQRRTSKSLLQSWRRWIEHKNKKQFLEKQAEVSGMISRSKILSRCVAQWLQQLKLKLKKKHLKSLNGKLPTQRKFFQAWISATVKQQSQQQKLTVLLSTYQVRLVKTAVQNWKLFTDKALNYKRIYSFCKQQYTYWLGKRVFYNLVRNAGVMRSKTRVLDTVLQEYLLQVKIRTFQAVKLYTKFRVQRRADDQSQIKLIGTKKARRMFGEWYRAASQRQGLRLLNSSVRLAQKRIGLGQIRSWVLNTSRCIQQHSINRLYQAFLSWAKIARFSKQSAHKIQQMILQKKAVVIGLWKKQTQAQILIKKVKLTQAAASIKQMKARVIAMLTLNVRLNSLNQKAEKESKRRLLKKVFTSLFINIGIQLKLQASEKSVAKKYNLSIKQKFLIVWLQSFKRTAYVISIVELMAMGKTKKIFTVFKQNLASQKQKQKIAMELKLQWQRVVVRRSLAHFSNIVKEKVSLRQETMRAVAQHSHRYINSAFLKLKSQVTLLTKPLSQLKLNRREKIKKQYLKVWISRCLKRIGKIRSILKINSYLFKRDLKKTVATWKQESRFLSNLESKTAMGYKILQAMRVKRAINCMHIYTQQRQLTRKFNETSQLFYSTLRKNQCFKILRRHKQISTEKNATKLRAYTFFKTLTSEKVLRNWKAFTRKHAQLRQSFDHLRQYQRRSLLPQVMFKWHLALQERLQEKQVERIAKQKHRQWMQMQALKGLVQFTILRMHKRQMIQQAEQLNQSKVKQRVFNKIALWKEYKNDIEERRQQLFFVIQDIAEMVCQKKAWQSLRANKNQMKQLAQSALNFRYRVLLRKLLGQLVKHVAVQRKLKIVHKQIQSKTQKQNFRCCFKVWHLEFLQCQAIKEAEASYKTNLVRKVISSWSDLIQLMQQKRYFATRNRLVLSVKAVEAWKRYVQYKNTIKLQKLKAYQQLARKLMHKSLKAFAIYKHRNALVELMEDNRARKTLRTFLLIWDRSLQLKLMRSDAFSNCYLLTVKYAFRNWAQNIDTLNRYNALTAHRNNFKIVIALNALKLNSYRVRASRYLDAKVKQARVRQQFATWRSITPFKQAKVINALKPSLERTLQMAFNQILNFNDHQRRLERMKESKIVQQKPLRSSLWLNQLLVQDTVNKLIDLHRKIRVRVGLQILKQHSHESKVSEQNVSFVARNLRQKQGSFVILLQYFLGKQRTKNSDSIFLNSLFQQWRSVGVPLLKKLNRLKEIELFSKVHRSKNTQSQFLALWIEAYRHKRNKNCVQAYITQNYLDSLQKKTFKQLRIYAAKQKPKHLGDRLCQMFNSVKVQRIFMAWINLMQNKRWKKQKWNDILWGCQKKRLKKVWAGLREQSSRQATIVAKYQHLVALQNERLLQTCMTQLQRFVHSQRIDRELGELAENHRERQLKRKLTAMLKWNKFSSARELRYSRQFAVFTAWKTQVREEKLLSQYLDECNFKPPPSVNPTHSYSDY